MSSFDKDAPAEERFSKKDRRKPKGRRKVEELYVEEERARSSIHTFDDPSLQTLFELGHITDVLGQIKSGKEATLYRAKGPEGLLAAKIYRDEAMRSFADDAVYREGRRIPKVHRRKLFDQAAANGITREQATWIYHEYVHLWDLHEASVPVPRPVIGPAPHDIARAGRVVLMAFIGNEEESAPRLADLRLKGRAAQDAWQQSLDIYVQMLKLGKVHGDYSSYNLLYWQGKVVVIDLPQMVELGQNRHVWGLLERDIKSLCTSFKRHGVREDPAMVLMEVKEKAGLNQPRGFGY